MESAIVLLSSGLDSTVNLFKAYTEMEVKSVLTFHYGQRAARREIEQSQKICKKLNVAHCVIELPWMKSVTSTSLVNSGATVPQGDDIKIDDHEQSLKTAAAVWVPNRNGIFLNIAAAFAEGLGARYVIPGFNREEAATFPDNSADYMRALDQSFFYSTSTQIRTLCYTTDLEKTEIARMGRELCVPFDLMWPCYFDGDEICRSCESCQRFLRATRGIRG